MKNPRSLESLTRWVDHSGTADRLPVTWMKKLIKILFISWREFQTNNLSLRSGALTYAMLLSMVPILAMSTAVVKGLGGGNQLREVVYRYIDTLEQSPLIELETKPTKSEEQSTHNTSVEKKPDRLTTHLRSAADQLFDYVDRTSFATLGTFGMLGIFLSVVLVLNHIESAMNTIWRVEAGRSLIRKITDYLTLVVLMPLSINVALAAGTILESQALAIHIDQFIPASWIQILLLKGVPIFFLSLTLYIVYLFFPNTKPKPLPTLIGALLAGALWFITQNIYISLQIGVAKYNAIYGSFATVPLFLIWIYFGWLFVLLGAQVAYAIEKESRYQLIENNDAPAIKLSAALDVYSAVKKSFYTEGDFKLNNLNSDTPGYTPYQLEEARDTLIAAGFLHHSKESNQLMPSQPPEAVSPKQIIEAVLGTVTPNSSGGKMSAAVVDAATNTTFHLQQNNSQDDTAQVERTPSDKNNRPE